MKSPKKPHGAFHVEAKLQVLDRRRRVAEMMLDAHTVGEIARVLNVSKKLIYADVASIKAMMAREICSDVRETARLELAGLQRLEAKLNERLRLASTDAAFVNIVDKLLQVKKRRAEMLGLDDPVELRIGVDRLEDVATDIVRAVCSVIPDETLRKKIRDAVGDVIVNHGGAGTWSPDSESAQATDFDGSPVVPTN